MKWNMKRDGRDLIRGFKYGVLLVVLAVVLSGAPAMADDWVDNWLDQSVYTQPGSIRTQQRGYYTGGAFQARWRMGNDYPVTVSPPRVSAGCGGIDMFAGGFSFMDAEYLVEKLERSVQAAPAVAFQMAMSAFCKECVTAITTMEEITNYLNSIQMNDCRLAKGIASIPFGDYQYFEGMQQKAMQGYAIITGQEKNQQGVDDSVRGSGGGSPVETRDAVSQCPAAFKTVFTNGSVIGNLTAQMGLAGYANLIRGMIGDIHVSYDDTLNNYRFDKIIACPGNDPGSSFDLITGDMQERAPGAGGACSDNSAKSVLDEMEERLRSIADKLGATGGGGAQMSAEDMAFISSAPFSVLNVLRDATKDGYVDEAILQIRDVLAPAYAAAMLNDFHVMSRQIYQKAKELHNNASRSTGAPEQCDVTFLVPALAHVDEMDDLSVRYRRMAMENYAKTQAELNANLQYATFLRDRRKQSVSSDTTQMR